MSYDIYIGNAELNWPDAETLAMYAEDGSAYHPDLIVRSIKHPEAPTFPHDGMTGNGNSRHPAYSVWGEFCRTVGLDEMFFGKKTGESYPGGIDYPVREKNGLMSFHPGCAVLTRDILRKIQTALLAYKELHPDAVPGFIGVDAMLARENDADDPRETANANMARLIWLEWWVRWAVTHCERPAIYNS